MSMSESANQWSRKDSAEESRYFPALFSHEKKVESGKGNKNEEDKRKIIQHSYALSWTILCCTFINCFILFCCVLFYSILFYSDLSCTSLCESTKMHNFIISDCLYTWCTPRTIHVNLTFRLCGSRVSCIVTLAIGLRERDRSVPAAGRTTGSALKSEEEWQ